MKKKKTDDQPAGDFRNTPFRSLKGFKPQSGKKEEKRAPLRRQETSHEDDSELFLKAMSGARRIGAGEGPRARQAETLQAEPAIPPTRDEGQLFLQAMRKIGTSMKEAERSVDEEDGREQRSASSRMRQLKRGTIRISDELDLHGFLRDEALTRLEHFVVAAYALQQDAVLVITGKGLNSPEGPVLQGAAAEWLRKKGKSMVAEFAPAPRDKGGSGAFVVFLRRK